MSRDPWKTKGLSPTSTCRRAQAPALPRNGEWSRHPLGLPTLPFWVYRVPFSEPQGGTSPEPGP